MAKPDDALDDDKAARRRDEVVKRTLATPPKPKVSPKAKAKLFGKRSEVKDSHDR